MLSALLSLLCSSKLFFSVYIPRVTLGAKCALLCELAWCASTYTFTLPTTKPCSFYCFATQCQCNTKTRYGEANLWYENQAEDGYVAEKVEEAENYESCVEEPNQRYVGDDNHHGHHIHDVH